MKKKALGIMMVCLMGVISLGSFMCPAVEASAVESENDATRTINIYWITRTTNGRTYQRLYNADTKEWLTDWILVG